MRYLLVTALHFFVITSYSQDTTYFDFDNRKVADLLSANYYKIIFRNEADTNKVITRTYFKNKQLRSEICFSDYSTRTNEGSSKFYYENGQLKRIEPYSNDTLNGELVSYWRNGILKRKDIYEHGTFIRGNCFSSTGNDTAYYKFYIDPVFKKNSMALTYYFKDNLKYPRDNSDKVLNEQGDVILSYVVNRDGSVSDVTLIESSNNALNNSALVFVKKMPRWRHCGMLDGEPVRVTLIRRIRFSLE